MKTTSKRLRPAFVLLVMIFAFRPPLVAKSQNQSNREQNTSVAAQNVQTMKWKFGGNDAGSSSYETHTDGTFASSTELNVAGMRLKSRLTGKVVDGAITEFELVNQQAGAEVQVSAKDGKARIKAGEATW